VNLNNRKSEFRAFCSGLLPKQAKSAIHCQLLLREERLNLLHWESIERQDRLGHFDLFVKKPPSQLPPFCEKTAKSRLMARKAAIEKAKRQSQAPGLNHK
jgi:hypothetical protein